MKNSLLIAMVTLVLTTSCSNDTNPTGNSENYLPLSTGNFWTYDVEGQTQGRDSLYVANDTVIGGSTFKKMKTQFLPFGFYTNSLANNGLKVSGSKIQLSGGLNFDLGTQLPLSLSVSNFTILDESAQGNTPLSTATGTFNHE